jgi:TRAP-type C4-dicarboxylate transport system permease small subunit
MRPSPLDDRDDMISSKLVSRLERVLTLVIAVALFAMMVLQFADVVARKLLNTGVAGSVELIELLMLVVVFAGLPLASLRAEHVLFDMLDPWLPAALMRWQTTLANIACAALLLGAGWLVLERAGRTAEFGDITPRLAIGLAKFHFAIGVLLFTTAALHLWLARPQRSGAAALAAAPRTEYMPPPAPPAAAPAARQRETAS